MSRTALAALVLPALLAAACTTVPPAERAAACQATDWSDYGYNDGRLGVPEDERAKKFADCAQLGHPADTAAYRAARARGLAEYCTVENGYDVGYSGRRYRRACPPELAQAFLQGYEQGRTERPVRAYPAFGFGFGYSHFGYRSYWGGPYWGGHRHRHHRHGDRKRGQQDGK